MVSKVQELAFVIFMILLVTFCIFAVIPQGKPVKKRKISTFHGKEIVEIVDSGYLVNKGVFYRWVETGMAEGCWCTVSGEKNEVLKSLVEYDDDGTAIFKGEFDG